MDVGMWRGDGVQRFVGKGKMLVWILDAAKHLIRKLIDMTKVQSETSAAPSLPVRIPQTLPVPLMMTDLESP